jgi:hypothetical protein
MTNSTRRLLRTSSTLTNGKVWAVLLAMGVLCGPTFLCAHHGNAAFDMKHPVKLQATVTDFQWINPHAVIHADVKDESGKVVNWALELGSLGMLTRFGGWSRDSVKRGDRIAVDGFRAKDGSPYMCAVRIELPNGQALRGAP